MLELYFLIVLEFNNCSIFFSSALSNLSLIGPRTFICSALLQIIVDIESELKMNSNVQM